MTRNLPPNLHLPGAPARTGLGVAAIPVVALALSVVLFLTLRPVAGGYEAPDTSLCLWCDSRAAADALANVILFIPFGAALALTSLPALSIIACGFLLSLAIEVFQFASIAGRDASLRDLLFNTAGAAGGLFLIRSLGRALRLPSRESARLSLLLAIGATCVIAFSAGLSSPDTTPGETLSVEWTEGRFSGETYGGRVVSVTIGDLPVPPGPLDNPDEVLNRLGEGQPLAIQVVAGPASTAYSEIFGLADDDGEIISIGLRGEALVIQRRTWGQVVRLARPAVVWADALGPRVAGDPFRVVVRETGNGYCAEIPPRSSCDLGLTIGKGWMPIFYSSYLPPPVTSALRYIWILALLLPVGFTLRARRASIVALAILLGVALSAPLLGLMFTPLREWVAGALALLSGAVLRSAAAAIQTPRNGRPRFLDIERRRTPRSVGPSQVWTRPTRSRRLR